MLFWHLELWSLDWKIICRPTEEDLKKQGVGKQRENNYKGDCWWLCMLDDLISSACPESLRPDQWSLPEGSRATILSLTVSDPHTIAQKWLILVISFTVNGVSLCCRVSRYRSEAVLLARGGCSLKNQLSEYEYQLECQSKELTALQLEQRTLREELAIARQQKEELLERWLEEKREEAERINKHNAALERWMHNIGCCIVAHLLGRKAFPKHYHWRMLHISITALSITTLH